MNKKGSILDIVQIGIIMVVLGLTTLVVFKVWTSFSDGFNAEVTNTYAIQSNNEMTQMYTGTIDNMFLFLLVGLSIVALVLASMVRIHPVFFVFFVFILVILIFISGVLANVYLEVANTAEFTAEAEQLTFITHIIGKLPFIVGLLGFLIAIIMYKNYTQE